MLISDKNDWSTKQKLPTGILETAGRRCQFRAIPFLAAALLPAHHFHHFNNLIFSIGKTRLIKSKTNQFQTDEVLYQILVNNDNYGDVGNLERKNNIRELDRW